MTDRQQCPPREELLLLLYDEGERDVQRELDAHLATCASCRDELGGLGWVKRALSAWDAPEPRPRVRLVPDSPPAPVRPWAWLLNPAFPLAAAATLVLGVAAGLANLEVSYGSSGLTIKTGWGSNASAPAEASDPATSPRTTAASVPWRSDLEQLEAQLRQEFAGVRTTVTEPATPVVTGGTDAELLARVQRLLDESEIRQQRNLALRVAELSRDFDLQRRADLVRIQQGLGETQAEAARTREMMNYFMRVSQQNPR